MAKRYREAPVAQPSTILREYRGFRGVDLTSDPTQTAPYRSPYGINVYKDYTSANGQAIETFPGYRRLAGFDRPIYGLHVCAKAGDEGVYEASPFQLPVTGTENAPGVNFAATADGRGLIEIAAQYWAAYRFENGRYVLSEEREPNAGDSFTGVAMAPDGNLAAAIGGQGVYLAQLGEEDASTWRYLELDCVPQCVAVTEEAEVLVAGSRESGQGILYEIAQENLRQQLRPEPAQQLAVGGGLVAEVTAGKLSFLRRRDGEYAVWTGHDYMLPLGRERFGTVAIAEGGSIAALLIGGAENAIQILQHGEECVCVQSVEVDGAADIAWNTAGDQLLATNQGGGLCLYAWEGNRLWSDREEPVRVGADTLTELRCASLDGLRELLFAYEETEDGRGLRVFERQQNPQQRILVHSGTELYHWTSFPYAGERKRLAGFRGAAHPSRLTVFGDRYYLHTGKDYQRYDWDLDEVISVREDKPTVPLTYRDIPVEGGGGVPFQPLNVLTPRRKNTFICDGAKTTFALVASDPKRALDEEPMRAWFRGNELQEGVDFTAERNANAHAVTFLTPPPAPIFPGEAELTVQFAQTMPIHEPAVEHCTVAAVYDNRIFFAGNPEAPNQYYHTQANDAEYISASAYYAAGTSSARITGLELIGTNLALYKRNDGVDASVFYLNEMDTGDELHPKAYPAASSLAGVGCVAPFGHLNFRDDPVFVSPYGLDAVGKLDINAERAIEHRSTTVDGWLANEPGLEEAVLQQWRGYLCCLVNGHLYLADSRQTYTNPATGRMEYEWYCLDTVGEWDGEGTFWPAIRLLSLDGELYFGTGLGGIYKYNHDLTDREGNGLRSGAYNNAGRAIFSCWVLPYDDCGLPNRFKRTKAQGARVEVKTHSRGLLKIRTRTERTGYREAGETSSGAFRWDDVSYEDYTFNTNDVTTVYFRPKEKKFERIACMLYSDAVDRPFGVYGVTYEVSDAGYSKANRE